MVKTKKIKRRTKKTLNRRIKRTNKKMSKRTKKRTKNRTNKITNKRIKKRTKKRTNKKMKNKRIHKLVRTTAWVPGIQVGGEVIQPIDGDLEIGTKIGKGGFASVYSGMYKVEPVAVKVFDEETGYNIGKRGFTHTMDIKCPFMELPGDEQFNGYIAGGKIPADTQGIPRGLWNKYAIILKLYSGVELFSKVREYQLSPEEKVKILSGILEQLICLHEAGLAHRDIKLENVLYDDKANKARLIDWDMAELAIKNWEKPDQKGTAFYCAPELVQFNKTKRDIRPGDMFAFGVMMYVMYEITYPWVPSAFDQRGRMGIGPKTKSENFKNVSIKWFRNTPFDFRKLIIDLLSADPESRPAASQALDIIRPPTEAPRVGGTGGETLSEPSSFDFTVSPSSSSGSDFDGPPRAGGATPRKAPPVRPGGTGTTGYTPERKKKAGGQAAPPPIVSSVPNRAIEWSKLESEERGQFDQLSKLSKKELIDIAKSLSIESDIITAFEQVEDEDTVKQILPTYILKSYRDEEIPGEETPGLIEWLGNKAKDLPQKLGGLAAATAVAALGFTVARLAQMGPQDGDFGDL